MPVAEKSGTFILDNGGYCIKAGYATQSSPRHVARFMCVGVS